MKAYHVILYVILCHLSVVASKPLDAPITPGVHGVYLYHTTDTIEGQKCEQAAVLRIEKIQKLTLGDTLIRNVIDDDIVPSIRLLEANRWLEKRDTTFYVIPLSTDHTHIAICEARFLDKKANNIVFAGYYKSRKYTFVFEKTLCDEFGSLSGEYLRARILYGWDDNDDNASAYQPVVWYLSRDQRNNACLVSGPPRIKGYGSTRVVY